MKRWIWPTVIAGLIVPGIVHAVTITTTIRWQAVPNLPTGTQYRVTKRVDNGAPVEFLKTQALEAVDSGQPVGKTYCYAVGLTNQFGNGPQSPECCNASTPPIATVGGVTCTVTVVSP